MSLLSLVSLPALPVLHRPRPQLDASALGPLAVAAVCAVSVIASALLVIDETQRAIAQRGAPVAAAAARAAAPAGASDPSAAAYAAEP